jgi:hypothetical protein
MTDVTTFTTIDPSHPTLTIAPGGKFLVKLWPDGRLEYGEGYDPDEAAKVFWEAIASHFPGLVNQH